MKSIFVCLVLLCVFLACGCSEPINGGYGTTATTGRASAAVNSVFIPQQELDDLVVAAYGRAVLDDMVLLEIVRQYAQKEGVVLTDQMYQREYQDFLEEIAPGKPQADQETIFAYMLSKRNITREIFDLILKKQALLKAVIDKEIAITDAMLQSEFERQFGQRRIVRLIQVNSMRKMELVEKLLAEGRDFIEVAMDYSEDELSLRSEALAGPFTLADDVYDPELVRRCFELKNIGEVSSSFMITTGSSQHWYIIRLEQIAPQKNGSLAENREQLEKTISQKEINRRIVRLQEQLQAQARVIIMDNRIRN